jgi:outer membrane receptor protein involved in Fe transport
LPEDEDTNKHELKRIFSYEDYPLDEFYVLEIETNNDFKTGDLEHETKVGIEVSKNPFSLSSEKTNSQTIFTGLIPSPFISADLTSKKNLLNFYIEHEIALSDRLSLNFEGTLDLAIADTTDSPELPVFSPQEYNNFSPELELSYQLTDSVSLYLNFNYATEPIQGSSWRGEQFKSEIYNGIEAGIDTELIADKLFAVLYFYNETQNNITTIDPVYPDFDTQINEQKSQSFGLELTSNITPGWDILIYYEYTDARITEDDRLAIGKQLEDTAAHSAGVWTTYEIQAGTWKGLGFGSGCWFVGDRPGDAENTFLLPSYLQTDAAIFYRKDNWEAALSIQNLFDTNVSSNRGTSLTLVGTFLVKF